MRTQNGGKTFCPFWRRSVFRGEWIQLIDACPCCSIYLSFSSSLLEISLSLFISLMRTFSFTSPPWLCPEQPLLLLTWADLLSISTAIIYCCPFHYISTNTIPTPHYISSAIICYLLSLSSSWELSLRENASAAQIHKYTNTHQLFNMYCIYLPPENSLQQIMLQLLLQLSPAFVWLSLSLFVNYFLQFSAILSDFFFPSTLSSALFTFFSDLWLTSYLSFQWPFVLLLLTQRMIPFFKAASSVCFCCGG